jgi:hypothetical protein
MELAIRQGQSTEAKGSKMASTGTSSLVVGPKRDQPQGQGRHEALRFEIPGGVLGSSFPL